MSSPDFLKRYRNDEDWPEIGEDEEEEDLIIQQELVDMSSLKLMPSKFSQLPQTFTKPAQKRYFHGQECLATRDEDHHVSKLVMLEDSIESATIKSQNFSEESPHDLEQKCFSKSMAVLDGEILEHDKSKNVTDTAGIKTISSVNMVREWKKSKTAEGKRRGSSGSSRRKRYDTDRV